MCPIGTPGRRSLFPRPVDILDPELAVGSQRMRLYPGARVLGLAESDSAFSSGVVVGDGLKSAWGWECAERSD